MISPSFFCLKILKIMLTKIIEVVLKFENPDFSGSAGFASFDDLLDEIGKIAQKQQVIFVIDEYPYLAESYPGFSSLLQKYIDRNF